MVKPKSLIAAFATAGLLLANPAVAASTRSGDALPSASMQLPGRGAAPVTGANDLNPQASRLLALFAIVGAVGLLVAASSGGGNNDSPG
jgi:hypothetical protein